MSPTAILALRASGLAVSSGRAAAMTWRGCSPPHSGVAVVYEDALSTVLAAPAAAKVPVGMTATTRHVTPTAQPMRTASPPRLSAAVRGGSPRGGHLPN